MSRDSSQPAYRAAYQAILGPSETIAANASVARQTANAKLYQAVAQSAALAVQSATSYTMNITAVSEAAMSVIEVNMIASAAAERFDKAKHWAELIAPVVQAMETGPKFMADVAAASAKVLGDMPGT